MPRKIRYIIPGIPHHAVQRGNNRQSVFFGKDDQEIFLSNLKKYASENKVNIGAYCLMTNHFHLLLYPETKQGIVRTMKFICQLHTQYINRKYQRSGKLWENRYKLHLVDPEYSWIIARYIERNPVRAGMIKKAERYEYSSAESHLLGKEDKILSENIIQGKVEEYRQDFNNAESMPAKQLEKIRTTIKQEKVLGGSKFIEEVEKRFKVGFQLRRRGRPYKINK